MLVRVRKEFWLVLDYKRLGVSSNMRKLAGKEINVSLLTNNIWNGGKKEHWNWNEEWLDFKCDLCKEYESKHKGKSLLCPTKSGHANHSGRKYSTKRHTPDFIYRNRRENLKVAHKKAKPSP